MSTMLQSLLDTPRKSTEARKTVQKTPRGASTSFKSAFEEVKIIIAEQEERHAAQMGDVLNILRGIDSSLKSIDASLNILCQKGQTN